MNFIYRLIREVSFHVKEHNLKITLRGLFKLALYALIVEIVALILYEIWHNKKALWIAIIGKAIFAWYIITSGIWKLVLIALSFIGFSLLIVFLWRKIHKPFLWWKLMPTVGIAISLASIGLYLVRTTEIIQPNEVINMVNSKFYIEDTIFSKIRHMDYQIIPTKQIKPDVPYRIIINNNKTTWEIQPSWNQTEINTGYPFTVHALINEAEYEALRQAPYFNWKVYQILPEHNLLFLSMPLAYLSLATITFLILKILKVKRRNVNKTEGNMHNTPLLIGQIITDHKQEQPIDNEQPTATKDNTEIDLDRCIECNSLKAKSGVFRCNRTKCKFVKTS